MECDKIRLLLDAFAEAELEPAQQHRVEEHLKQCISCQKELSAIRRTIRLLTEFGEVNEPADFVQQFRQRVEARQPRHILDRLLPRSAMPRVLVGISYLILAGLGAWLAFKQLSPREQTEEYRAEKDSSLKRIARVPRGEKVFFSEKAEDGRGRGFKAGDEVDLLRRARKEQEAYSSEDAHYSRPQGTARGTTQTPLRLEESDKDMMASVVAKGSPAKSDWDRQAGGPGEGQQYQRERKLDAEAGLALRYAFDAEKKARELGEPGTTPPAESLPQAGAAWSETAAKQVELAKEEAKEALASAAAHGLGRGGAAGSEARPSITTTRERLEAAAEEEPAEPANYYGRPDTKKEKFAHRLNGEGIEGRLREEVLGQETALAALPAKPPKEPEERKDISGPAPAPGRRHEITDGVAEKEEGMTVAGQEQFRAANLSVPQSLFLGSGNFVTGYDILGRAIPELVLHVKRRDRAVAEIRKIVADLGGTVDHAFEEGARSEQTFGAQKADFLVVKLKPGTYQSFREKLFVRPPSAEAGRPAPEQPEVAGGKKVKPQQEGTVTLLIRVIEIAEQDQP